MRIKRKRIFSVCFVCWFFIVGEEDELGRKMKSKNWKINMKMCCVLMFVLFPSEGEELLRWNANSYFFKNVFCCFRFGCWMTSQMIPNSQLKIFNMNKWAFGYGKSGEENVNAPVIWLFVRLWCEYEFVYSFFFLNFSFFAESRQLLNAHERTFIYLLFMAWRTIERFSSQMIYGKWWIDQIEIDKYFTKILMDPMETFN